MRNWVTSLGLIGFLLGGSLPASGEPAFPEPLPTEQIMQFRNLPYPLPAQWVYVDMLGPERVELIDPTVPAPRHVKGMIGASYVANFLAGTARNELYVAETFFSRRPRGVRTDVVSIYDSKTMAPLTEIELPARKRVLQVMLPNAFQFTDQERMGLVFNFTPASSVSVLDLPNRKVLGEVPTPGCALIYPSGKRGFASLCSDGTMLAVTLDEKGEVLSQSTSRKINDLDKDPLFSTPAVYGQQNYFVSFLGTVQPVDLSGETPAPGEPWSLVDARDSRKNWRPSGHQLAALDRDGKLYVIMQENGREGSHKDGGTEVWIFDTAAKKRIARVKLSGLSQSIAVSAEVSSLYVTGAAANLERYDTRSGKLLSSQAINSFGAQTVIVPVGQ